MSFLDPNDSFLSLPMQGDRTAGAQQAMMPTPQKRPGFWQRFGTNLYNSSPNASPLGRVAGSFLGAIPSQPMESPSPFSYVHDLGSDQPERQGPSKFQQLASLAALAM